MRFTLPLCVSLLAIAFSACKEDDDGPRPQPGTLVFGITQTTDARTGETFTTAGYEYRTIGWNGESFGPWTASVQSVPDGWCRTVDFAMNRSRLHVGDGGRARFSGGSLGADVIELDANGEDVTRAGPAFDPSQPLRFAVDRGFGLPPFDPVELPAIHTSLRLDSPKPDEEVIRANDDGELLFTWTPSAERGTTVMVSLEEDASGAEVRCWFGEETGVGRIPKDRLTGIASGVVHVWSQRPEVVTPGDGWLVHVISSAVFAHHRFVAF